MTFKHLKRRDQDFRETVMATQIELRRKESICEVKHREELGTRYRVCAGRSATSVVFSFISRLVDIHGRVSKIFFFFLYRRYR